MSEHPRAAFLTYEIATDTMGRMVAWYGTLPPPSPPPPGPQETTPRKLMFCVVLDGGAGEMEGDVSFDAAVVLAGGAPSGTNRTVSTEMHGSPYSPSP